MAFGMVSIGKPKSWEKTTPGLPMVIVLQIPATFIMSMHYSIMYSGSFQLLLHLLSYDFCRIVNYVCCSHPINTCLIKLGLIYQHNEPYRLMPVSVSSLLRCYEIQNSTTCVRSVTSLLAPFFILFVYVSLLMSCKGKSSPWDFYSSDIYWP